MKRFLCAINILLCLSLCACYKPPVVPEHSPAPLPELWEDQIDTNTDTVHDDSTVMEPPAGDIAIAPAMIESGDGSHFLLSTDYYSLLFPKEWVSTCNYTLVDLENGVYTLSIYEAKAYLQFSGGNLCTITMIPTEEDYTFFPSYELLGVLNTPMGEFHLVAIYPTDVQFTAETMESYNQMLSQLPDVLRSLTPAQGVELALP